MRRLSVTKQIGVNSPSFFFSIENVYLNEIIYYVSDH
nr:MAG TPA: hypothetical protein [Caudoviricetes sp.]